MITKVLDTVFFLENYEIADRLVTNGEYIEFIENGGYQNFELWLSEGYDFIGENKIKLPLYWKKGSEGIYKRFTLEGWKQLDPDEPVSHISYFEADAYARYKNARLPTEFEWEAFVSQNKIDKGLFLNESFSSSLKSSNQDFLGSLWQWTSSSYEAYPFFKKEDGALGEYNGKFMVNQYVLRGGSIATARNHFRLTYRNFFQLTLAGSLQALD